MRPVFSNFWTLLAALPEILKLIESIQKRIDQGKLENKVHEDLAKISEAFEKQDEEKLKNLFNS